MIPVSFDVVSLYTNININEAVETTLEYTRKYDLYLFGLETSDLFELLHLLLDNSIFAYNDVGFYKQIRGLAMGNRLSGTLAIITMDRFEQLFIYPLKPPLTIYVRYVDDIGTTTPNIDAPNRLLTHLNNQHPTIKFELELPDRDGYLPILETKINIDDHGKIQYKFFTKVASKGITLNYRSHHPRATKVAVIRNEFHQAELCSLQTHRSEAIAATQVKVRNNGYPHHWINAHTPRKKKTKKEQHLKFTFNIPFVSDRFNYQIKHLLAKHNIPAHLVNKRGPTILEITKKHHTTDSRCL